jgi:hypothetical protein
LAALSFVVLTIFSEIALVRLPARVDNRRGGVLGCWMLAGVVVGVVGVVGVGVVGVVGVVVKEVGMVEVFVRLAALPEVVLEALMELLDGGEAMLWGLCCVELLVSGGVVLLEILVSSFGLREEL